jgi:hypothetical protein
LEIQGWEFEITDCTEKYKLKINNYNMGLIIWFDNVELFEPNILNAEIIFYKDQIKFTKDVDIQKININNKNGYFISTNKLNFDQIFSYYKKIYLKKDFNILDDLINWSDDIKDCWINIQWTIYENSSRCVIEKLTFNL